MLRRDGPSITAVDATHPRRPIDGCGRRLGRLQGVGLPQGIEQNGRGLGPGRGDAGAEEEEGDAGDAQGSGGGLVGAHLVGEGAVFQDGGGGVGIQTHVGGQAAQGGGVVEVETLVHVGLEEPFLEGVLSAGAEGVGPGQEAVRLEGVAGADTVEPKVDADVVPCLGHAVDEGLGVVPTHAVLGRQPADVVDRLGRGGRGLRVELEGPSHHLGWVVELGEGRFEVLLAHPTPGAGDIRPDLKLHGGSPFSASETRSAVVSLGLMGTAAAGR